jgi:hypothetical protein
MFLYVFYVFLCLCSNSNIKEVDKENPKMANISSLFVSSLGKDLQNSHI